MPNTKRSRRALPDYLTRCHRNPGHLTSTAYADKHNGMCKRCYYDAIDTGNIIVTTAEDLRIYNRHKKPQPTYTAADYRAASKGI